ncbi:P-loop containing nucleoside triphosphate hydrolase protein [Diaporthe sp. PMI_573]|nr:P-loop containing nucleoside triphosphate hydrolase protein [Diaporthaceae sp. PMI_573]
MTLDLILQRALDVASIPEFENLNSGSGESEVKPDEKKPDEKKPNVDPQEKAPNSKDSSGSGDDLDTPGAATPDSEDESAEAREEKIQAHLRDRTVVERYDSKLQKYVISKQADDEMKEPKVDGDHAFLLRTKYSKVVGDHFPDRLNVIASSIRIERLFHVIPCLLAHWRACPAEVSADYDLLMHWADDFHGGVRRDVEALAAQNQMQYDLLWAFFEPGAELFGHCLLTQEPLCGTFLDMEKLVLWGHDQSVLIDYRFVNANADSRPCFLTETIKIRHFDGNKRIQDLEVYPLAHHPDAAALRARLVSRGQRFADLASSPGGFCHIRYKGTAYNSFDIKKSRAFFADCRGVIDPQSFARYGPGNTYMYIVPIDDAEGDKEVWDKLTSEQHLICSPTTVAYLLGPNTFAVVAVDKIEDINWGVSASFSDDIMMDRLNKTAIRAVATSALQGHQSNAGNDGGIKNNYILTFYGPSGVGKTSTAEALAEEFRAPILHISSARLQGSDGSFETWLDRTFQLCTRWRALLLMDEADIYLTERHPLMGPNAIIGIFLRMMEKFRGLLILTTNRYGCFDIAIRDRVDLAIEYPALNATHRKALWENILKPECPKLCTKENLQTLAKLDQNGRQIKSNLKLAITLASSRKEDLSIAHIQDANKLQEQKTEPRERDGNKATESYIR